MKLITDFIYKSECYYQKSGVKNVLRVLLTDGSTAMILYRLTYYLQRIRLGIIGHVFAMINKYLNGCIIGRKAQFDEGFVLMHPVGVVINGAVKGGKYICIESGVVIGAARNGLPVEVPTIGSRVLIGSGAKVLGNIVIGNNVTIGANAVVTKDVPHGATVVGIPARIVKIDGREVG